MSLKPFSAYVAHERTASIASAAFPDGNLCIRIFDDLGTSFQDQDFADLYSQHGQPGQPPFRLTLASVLQFIEGLSPTVSCPPKGHQKSPPLCGHVPTPSAARR